MGREEDRGRDEAEDLRWGGLGIGRSYTRVENKRGNRRNRSRKRSGKSEEEDEMRSRSTAEEEGDSLLSGWMERWEKEQQCG